MTIATDELGSGLGAAAEVWAPGTAIVAVGAGEDGADSLAVWHVSPAGTPTGAWIVPRGEAFASKETAHRLVALLERRAITAAKLPGVDDVVGRLTAIAGLQADQWWSAQVFTPADSFAEIVARREAFDATVSATKADGKKVADLDWPQDLQAHDMPDDIDGLRRVSRLAPVTGPPVVSEVIGVARVLAWLVRLWAQTEQVKNRRDYARAAHGVPEPLPPSWLSAVQTARSTRLPL